MEERTHNLEVWSSKSPSMLLGVCQKREKVIESQGKCLCRGMEMWSQDKQMGVVGCSKRKWHKDSFIEGLFKNTEALNRGGSLNAF